MAQRRNDRKIGNIKYLTGAMQSLDIPAGFTERNFQLLLSGKPTCTGANNTNANTKRGDGWGVAKAIRLNKSDGSSLINTTGNDLRYLNALQRLKFPHVTAALGDAATANPAFNDALWMDFAWPNMQNPLDTALYTRVTGGCQLQVDWGAFTDVNSLATAWTTEPVMKVWSQSSFGEHVPHAIPRILKLTAVAAGADTNFKIDLKGAIGLTIKQIMIVASNAGQEQGALFSQLRVFSGSQNFQEFIDEQALWQRTWFAAPSALGWERSLGAIDTVDATGVGSGNYGRPTQSDLNRVEGVYNIEFPTDGRASECLKTQGYSELQIEMATTGASTYDVTIVAAEPFRLQT